MQTITGHFVQCNKLYSENLKVIFIFLVAGLFYMFNKHALYRYRIGDGYKNISVLKKLSGLSSCCVFKYCVEFSENTEMQFSTAGP